jgi:hypothetical protein
VAVASLKDRGGVRSALIAAVVLCTFALTARNVGEPDRDRAEPGAIGAVRAIQSGELAYASINEGYYDTLECLAAQSCVPGVRGERAFLDPDLAATKERNGYRFEFHGGPRAEPRSDQRTSRSAITRFAIVAIPLNPRPVQRRAFCGDDTRSIYFTSGGTVPRVEAGRCLDTENSIR